MGSVVGFLADLLSILSVFKDHKDLLVKLKELSKRQKVIGISILLLVAGIVYLIWFCIFGGFSPTITQVTLSEYSLDMTTGDTGYCLQQSYIQITQRGTMYCGYPIMKQLSKSTRTDKLLR